MTLTQIGIIHTPFTSAAGTPIQPSAAAGAIGTVEVFDAYAAGLLDLEGFDRIWLLYWFDRTSAPKLRVVPYKDDREHGLFATRAPCRPTPIGMSAVRLVSIEGTTIRIADADMLDGTPLVDIKPYVPSFDVYPVSRCGWIDRASDNTIADDRFEQNRNRTGKKP